MEILYDPLEPGDKRPVGAAAQNEGVALQIRVTDEKFYDSAWVVLTKDGEQPVWHRMAFRSYSGGLVCFSAVLSGMDCGLYFYRFAVCAGGETFFFGRGEDGRGRPGSEAPFELTVFRSGFTGCPWFRGAVMYHVFVDRFFRVRKPPTLPETGRRNPVRDRRYHADVSETPEWRPDGHGRILNNDFYGGSLDGVTAKLGYLESLSVDVIYLSPIFEAVSNHKYDTGDYERIDEGFGGLAAFRRLIAAAHARGIRVVLDGVFNHTGDDSRYFDRYGEYGSCGAFQSRNSPWFDWYDFSQWPDRYRCWWGVDILPCLKQTEGFEDFIAGEGGVLDRWLSEGADGFRLDVVDELGERFVEKIRARLSRHPDKLLIGEVWEDASNKLAYGRRRKYFLGDELDSVMNYPLRDAIVASLRNRNFHILASCVRELVDHYPKCVLDGLMNSLSTHDTPRILTALMRDTKRMSRTQRAQVRLEGAELAEGLRRQRAAAFLQFFLFGNPSVYYGDELAMQGAEDPFNRAYFRWQDTEQAHSPGGEMLAYYRKLAAFRRAHPELKDAAYRTRFCSERVFVFSRGELLFGVNESETVFRLDGFEIPPLSVSVSVMK